MASPDPAVPRVRRTASPPRTRRDPANARRVAAPREPIPLRHPALIALGVVVAILVMHAVAYRLTTPDFWQHLLVGKAIHTLGRVPMEHLWTWPSYGQREVLPSWGFAWLLWPFWTAGELMGLQVWRWLTTLLAFGFGWAAARQLGARGVTPLFVVAVAVLSFRARAQVRPETLVAVLLALEIWLLERRRARGGGAVALVAIAAVWANVHLSWWIGLALLGIHAVAGRDRRSNVRLLGLAVLASFANPFGWRALWEPFEYFLVWRNEPVYRSISELAPLWATWRNELRSGLPLLVLGWPLLILLRAARRRFDAAEALTAALFTALALFNQRFAGFLVVAMVPYLARDLAELAGPVRGPAPLRRPAARAALAALLAAAASVPAWTDPRFRPGFGFVETLYPRGACDFLAAHGIRGRVFNPYYYGGYLAWRFWPERERLPFMDIHQSGTRKDRALYAYAFANPESWNELMRERDFEIALLDGHQEWVRGDRLLDVLDADPAWSLVFRDDAAAVYVRRDGRLAAVADSFGYRVMPGGNEGFVRLGGAIPGDTFLRQTLRAELERRVRASPLNAQAHSHLANLDFLDGDRAGARRHLTAALAVEPTLAGAHRRLGYLELAEGRYREAIRALEAERASGAPVEDEYARIGEAWEKLGDRARAAAAYRRHLELHYDDEAVRAALGRVAGGR